MALVTQPKMNVPHQSNRMMTGLKSSAAASGGVSRSSTGDYPKLVLIGEPGSGWRAAFDIIPGGRIMVGRPNHASRNMINVAYLPSRAVSRMHAIITMEEDGIYLTHTKTTNLTWHTVESVWAPMRPGDRTPLQHTDTLCFGASPKTRTHINKVDTPFLVSIAIAPRGEPPNKFQYVRKTIHRPSTFPPKSRELDPTMQLLMNGLDGLNVSTDRANKSDGQEDEETSPPMGKRKRGEADDAEASTATMHGTVATVGSSSTVRSTRPTRSSSLSNSPARPLPTARAVFGLASLPPRREKENEDGGDAASKSVDNSIGDASSKKRRVLDEDEPERVYCGDASDLPESMTGMELSA